MTPTVQVPYWLGNDLKEYFHFEPLLPYHQNQMILHRYIHVTKY